MTQASVLNHLWQSTLFAAAAGLLTLALRKNRAPVRYWLWFAASLKFLIPFSLLVTIGSQFEWAAPPLPSAVPLSSVMDQISQQPLAEVPRIWNDRRSRLSHLATSAASKLGGTGFQPVWTFATCCRPFTPPAPTQSSRTPVFFGVWLCGFSVVAFAWARQWRRVRAVLRAASPLELNLPIKAMSSPARLEPGVFGVFRPVLLLPEGITGRLTPAQWQAILAHELCHVRRRDNLTAAIHMAVEAIFWFHPLVWWIGRRLVDERERACDEEVVLIAGNPQDYAEGILTVCKLNVESPLRCVSGVTGSDLKKRIRAIMTERVPADLSLAKKIALAVAGMAALALPIVVGIAKAPPLRAQSLPVPGPPAAAAPAPVKPSPRILAQNQPRSAPEPEAPAPAAPKLKRWPKWSSGWPPVDSGTYIIGASDTLNIQGFEKDFTRLYRVRTDGMITVPLFGEMKAEGLTPLQIEQQLSDLLSGSGKNPQVSVTVWEAENKEYTATGQVKRPGSYPLSRPTTVFDAIFEAGGFVDNFSDQTDILILRGTQTLHFNYEDHLRGENRDRNVALENGDTIVVK